MYGLHVKVYIPPMWLYNRAIVTRKSDGIEFVLRRLRLEDSRETSTVELIPVNLCKYFQPKTWDVAAIRVSLDVVETAYTSAGQMSVTRAPL